MRIIIIRAKATMHIIESCCIVNDDVAIESATELRLLDRRDEYRVDILIPELPNDLLREFIDICELQ